MAVVLGIYLGVSIFGFVLIVQSVLHMKRWLDANDPLDMAGDESMEEIAHDQFSRYQADRDFVNWVFLLFFVPVRYWSLGVKTGKPVAPVGVFALGIACLVGGLVAFVAR